MKGLADAESLQRWWQEHSELDHLVSRVEDALAGSSFEPARAALEDLADALEAHFALEESVYFPLVERFSPQHAALVRDARTGHAKISESLDQMRELVENGEIAPARRTLAGLLDRFRLHESEEVQLISELQAMEVGAPSPATKAG